MRATRPNDAAGGATAGGATTSHDVAPSDAALVVAAQDGDRRALDELVARHLPLVYTIARRALSGDPDIDDVVQETMLRALGQLRLLRNPESFRPWLAAITVRQIGTHLRRERAIDDRTAALDEAAGLADPDAGIEDVTLLGLELSRQRRQLVLASHWIDPDDRALLSLWWLETAGRLTRSEVAAALGVSVAHAGVRVQRMRDQLGVSRSVLAAMAAKPVCRQLSTVVADWDGIPRPLWRKRLARHTRDCARCSAAAAGLVPPERLLVGFALLPVPLALAATIGKSLLAGAAAGAASALPAASGTVTGGAGAGASGAGTVGAVAGAAGTGGGVGLVGHLVQALAAHPVAAVVTAGALIAGTAVTTTTLRTSEPPPPPIVAAPAPTASTNPTPAPATARPPAAPPSTAASPPTAPRRLAPGSVSLESVNAPGRFVSTSEFLGVLAPVGPASAGADRERATFAVVPGLADAACFSFRTRDGWYLRHSSWRVRLSLDQGTALFRGDATFCARAGSATGSVALESSNYPGWFLRHRNNELWVDQRDDSPSFRADGSFRVRAPLTR